MAVLVSNANIYGVPHPLKFVQLARYTIGLTWIYHGIFPKLLHIAPLEQLMTGSLGFTDDISYLVTKVAGIAEVLFGIVFICFYRIKAVQLLNIASLVGLLAFAAIMTPFILVEAFNPVTTNIPLIVMSFYLLGQQEKTM